jgi:hypothetical protein
MRLKGLKSILLAAAAAVFAFSQAASAAFVPWTTPAGSNGLVSWSGGGSTDALWGDPVVTGLNFTFSNMNNFRAEGTNGSAQTTDGLLRFNVDIAPGNQITGFSINENGFYSILGLGSVNASGKMLILDRDTNIVYEDPDLTVISPVGGFPVINGTPFGSTSGSWNGFLSVQNLPNGVTRVQITVDNNLQAISVASGPGVPTSTAFIDKKLGGGEVKISIFVPEPGTLGLLVCGAPLLMRRRRS